MAKDHGIADKKWFCLIAVDKFTYVVGKDIVRIFAVGKAIW